MAKAKDRTIFVCTSCGAQYSKWMGRCEQCDLWNTIAESAPKPESKSGRERTGSVKASKLSDVEQAGCERIMTSSAEFNLVCGGGIVPGSVVLIGGEPGIGKSTLSLQIAGSFRTLYISGEESPVQIRQRAQRLGIAMENVLVSSNTSVDEIEQLIRETRPVCIFIDSIQTISVPEIPAPAGSVSQVRESAAQLTDIAKMLNIPLFLIGHITKEGSIAGPKILEHIVDTVLYFEGDFTREFRILRAFKNRYGSVNEIGLFRMTQAGLAEVKEKNSIFINPNSSNAAGSSVGAAIEGSRTILFEVQSLATFSSFANPRRMSDGFDINRLILIAAVLEKHAGIKLSNFDLFLNVAGGFSINETAADLAVAMSVASSVREKPIPKGVACFGEISLSGEIRPVSQPERRATELVRSGFTKIIVSKKDAQALRSNGIACEIIEVKDIAAAAAAVL
ncbi:MAG: DNA repair protein RadA [Spirochaetota bacterium]